MVEMNEIHQKIKLGAIVVDVRTPGEFDDDHFAGSINIPVQILPQSIEKLDKSKDIILCCASGGRSAMAELMLRSEGFEHVFDVGAWKNLLGN